LNGQKYDTKLKYNITRFSLPFKNMCTSDHLNPDIYIYNKCVNFLEMSRDTFVRYSDDVRCFSIPGIGTSEDYKRQDAKMPQYYKNKK
jgi:hypothetical protein